MAPAAYPKSLPGAFPFPPITSGGGGGGVMSLARLFDMSFSLIAAFIGDIWVSSQGQNLTLESDAAVGVTDPPINTSMPPVSGVIPQGVVAVFATLTTAADGIICSDFKLVDTGS